MKEANKVVTKNYKAESLGMRVFSRNKTADSIGGTSKNGSSKQQQLQGKNQSASSVDQRDSSNSTGGRRSLGFRSFGISKGLKQNKTSNTTQSGHLKNAMQQEQSRHRGSNTRNVSPDITEESSFYSGSEGSWDTVASLEAGNDCGFFGGFGCDDDDESCSDDEREVDSVATPVPALPPKGSKQKKSEKSKTTESHAGYPAQITSFFGLATSDTPKEISCGSEGGSLDKAAPLEDANACVSLVTDVLGDPDNESAVESSASSAPIGIPVPDVSGFSAWLFAVDYDKSQSDLAKKKKVINYVDRTAELNNHQGQLDIYAKSPGSMRLRLYPNGSRRPDRRDHVLVKVEVS